jgi:hypothetical protein
VSYAPAPYPAAYGGGYYGGYNGGYANPSSPAYPAAYTNAAYPSYPVAYGNGSYAYQAGFANPYYYTPQGTYGSAANPYTYWHLPPSPSAVPAGAPSAGWPAGR